MAKLRLQRSMVVLPRPGCRRGSRDVGVRLQNAIKRGLGVSWVARAIPYPFGAFLGVGCVFWVVGLPSWWWRLGGLGALLWGKGARWCRGKGGFGFALLKWWNQEFVPHLQELKELNQQILLPMLALCHLLP